jgi:hypothetical protein
MCLAIGPLDFPGSRTVEPSAGREGSNAARSMGALGVGASEIGGSSEGHASIPLGTQFPGSGIVLRGRFGRERKDRDVGCVWQTFFRRRCRQKPIQGDSVEVYTFLLGGTGTGEPEPERCGSKAEASQTPGAAKVPNSVPRQMGGQGKATKQITPSFAHPSQQRPKSNQAAIRASRLVINDRIPKRPCKKRGQETRCRESCFGSGLMSCLARSWLLRSL